MCVYGDHGSAVWAGIKDVLPVQRGNVRLNNLQVLNAVLYVAEQGCKWRGLPKRFGRWHTIYTRMNEGEDEVVKLANRLVGRFACDDIVNPTNPKEFLIRPNEEIDEEKAKRIEVAGIDRVRIRSVLTCESKHGICIHCYGRNLATGGLVKLGEAVGMHCRPVHRRAWDASLTMRTFHIGGTAAQVFKIPQIKSKHDGTIRYNELRLVEARGREQHGPKRKRQCVHSG